MTEQQQKLYDKLLKKVNEYCLGAAAKDVIAAIDALVGNYEDQLDNRYVFFGSRMCGKTEELMRRANAVQKLKALEIIKNKQVNVRMFMRVIEENWSYEKLVKYHDVWCISLDMLTEQEYELLKEVLK